VLDFQYKFNLLSGKYALTEQKTKKDERSNPCLQEFDFNSEKGQHGKRTNQEIETGPSSAF
jgi:hypothetical protein